MLKKDEDSSGKPTAEEGNEMKKDRNGHIWIHRGTNVCPFKCSKCGALSGTDDTGNPCKKE